MSRLCFPPLPHPLLQPPLHDTQLQRSTPGTHSVLVATFLHNSSAAVQEEEFHKLWPANKG